MALIEHLLIARGNLRHVAHEHVEALLLGQHGCSGATLTGAQYDYSLHRIFNVIMVIAANIMVVIQKRIVIFDSWKGRWGQPFRM